MKSVIIFPMSGRLRKGRIPSEAKLRAYPAMFDRDTFAINTAVIGNNALQLVYPEDKPELSLREETENYLNERTNDPPQFDPNDELARRQVRLAMQAVPGEHGVPPHIMPRFQQLQNMLIDPTAAAFDHNSN